MKFAEVFRLGQQIANVAEPERPIDSLVMILNQVIDHARLYIKAHLWVNWSKQTAKLDLGRIKNFDFVGNPTQERFVAQRFGFEVGRENQQLFKWQS